MSIAEPRYSDRRDVAAALRTLPRRRAHDATAETDTQTGPTVQWQRIGTDAYEVHRGGIVLGYIDVVGAVFVVHAGARRDHAVEVRQSLVWDDAVDVLADR